MTLQPSFFDKPTIRTYAGDVTANRHKGNARSVEAFGKVRKIEDSKLIVEYLRIHETGTSKEIARWLEKQLNQISGRFTEMAGTYIVRTGFKREGCDVWKLK